MSFTDDSQHTKHYSSRGVFVVPHTIFSEINCWLICLIGFYRAEKLWCKFCTQWLKDWPHPSIEFQTKLIKHCKMCCFLEMDLPPKCFGKIHSWREKEKDSADKIVSPYCLIQTLRSPFLSQSALRSTCFCSLPSLCSSDSDTLYFPPTCLIASPQGLGAGLAA